MTSVETTTATASAAAEAVVGVAQDTAPPPPIPVPVAVKKPKQDWRESVEITFNQLMRHYVQTESIFIRILHHQDEGLYGVHADEWCRFLIELAKYNELNPDGPYIEAEAVVEDTKRFEVMNLAYGWRSPQQRPNNNDDGDAGLPKSEPRLLMYIWSDDDKVLTPNQLKIVMELLNDLVYDHGWTQDFIAGLKEEFAINKRS